MITMTATHFISFITGLEVTMTPESSFDDVDTTCANQSSSSLFPRTILANSNISSILNLMNVSESAWIGGERFKTGCQNDSSTNHNSMTIYIHRYILKLSPKQRWHNRSFSFRNVSVFIYKDEPTPNYSFDLNSLHRFIREWNKTTVTVDILSNNIVIKIINAVRKVFENFLNTFFLSVFFPLVVIPTISSRSQQ